VGDLVRPLRPVTAVLPATGRADRHPRGGDQHRRDDAPVRKWLLEHPTSFQILRDPDGVVAEQLGMRVMPTSFLIDSRGVIRARHEGFRDEDEPAIEAEVRGLFAGG